MLRQLVAGLSPQRPGFAPGSGHVGFFDKQEPEQVIFETFGLRLSI
jgi:hypothetical protein